MLQSKAKIIPVFYQVEPWELRFIEKGVYAKAFAKYKNEKRYWEKLPEWKEALQSLSFVAGEEFNGDCKNIIAAVQKEVQKKTYLHVATYPVGLNNLVEDFERRCLDELVQDFENQYGLEEEKHKVMIVGIFGMGGSGKTTLAKELFNRKSSNYCRASFLFDVREACVKGQLPSLQLQLLKDLFQDHHLSFTSTEVGTNYLKNRVQRSPILSFLFVVDDIDHVEQLNALMVMEMFKKSGNTLVIVTSRDVGVLITAGITVNYNLKGMDRNNGRELFCWHAFDQPNSSDDYKMLVDAFVDVCGGLPLSLQVLGRHVHGRPYSFWSSALIEARKMLPRDVKQRLRISFDALGGEEKQVFMDIACFFIGKPKNIAERVWEGSGWNAQHALETLKDKCLVEEIEILSLNVHEGLVLRMHDHLRDLGREMALDLRPPHRLWRPQDMKYLESTGFKSILGKTHVRCFHSIFDKYMSSQVTFFLGQPDICFETSASLLWLELQGNSTEQPCIPSWISLQNVQCLKIKREQLKTLWENRIQAPSQLKELQISETFLEKIPDFSGISDNLENVVLDARGWPIQGLSLLESLSMNLCSICLRSSTLKGEKSSTKIEGRTSCESLVIWNFKFSGEVVWNNRGMSSNVKVPMAGLEKIEISDEELVSKILISGIHYPSLEPIKLHCMENLREVDLISIKSLNCLDITNCKHLKSLSGMSNLAKLVLLNITKCPELEELSLGHLSCLERMTIVGCKRLKSVSGILDLGNVVRLNVYDSFSSVSGAYRFRMLAQLNISECPELEKLLSFSSWSCLQKVDIASCGKLQNLMLPTTLIKLSVQSCKDLQRVVGDLTELTELFINECPELDELPSFSGMSLFAEI
ncbi:disease resistance protein Roq1 [Cryptomeria japonica]|uniref:disease resistance protein Roq1 n=1 Tax=Cryptomeria japonica TaxID=3369 RepID=UPI0027D9DD5D|nr:disease resistance protein Roq1 [Cryptomeria japonica]XP_057863269.2 disease resistance protein Roq1 [Cryptomeria japonica]